MKQTPRAEHLTELIVALDFPKAERALAFVEEIGDLPVIYKIGLELFLAAGPEIVRELVHRKKRIFLDLKFYDIPNTVVRAALQAACLHVEMLTIHLAGGSAMVRMVAEEFAAIPELRPKILGVTVLTSFDDVRWAEVTKALTGHPASIADSVDGLVEHALAWGVDGLVCSAAELSSIRKLHPSLYTVVPGIRPEGVAANDQARIMTPAQAHLAGASAIVVGRPITEAADPRGMIERILKELSVPRISA